MSLAITLDKRQNSDSSALTALSTSPTIVHDASASPEKAEQPVPSQHVATTNSQSLTLPDALAILQPSESTGLTIFSKGTSKTTQVYVPPRMRDHILQGPALGPLFPDVIASPFISANPAERNAALPAGKLTKIQAAAFWSRKPRQEIHLYDDQFNVTAELNYVDIKFRIKLKNCSELSRPFYRWDTIVINDRHHPNIRFLITHRRFTDNAKVELQVNAFTRDRRCLEPYHLEWPSFILVVDPYHGSSVPRPDVIRELDLKLQSTFDNHIDTASIITTRTLLFGWFFALIRWITWMMLPKEEREGTMYAVRSPA